MVINGLLLGVLAILATAASACTSHYDPVCGSDGRTYLTECDLASMAKAKPALGLEVAHRGKCHDMRRRSVTSTSKILENNTEADATNESQVTISTTTEKANAMEAENRSKTDAPEVELSCPCGVNFEAICGTGGVTEDNPCLLKCVAKFKNNIELPFEGKCNGTQLVAQVIHVDFMQLGTDVDSIEEDFESATASSTVKITDKGNSGAVPVASYIEDNDHKSRITRDIGMHGCVCSRENNPMCGSDGVTYSNPCVLRCASRKNRSIRLNHEGHCYPMGKIVI